MVTFDADLTVEAATTSDLERPQRVARSQPTPTKFFDKIILNAIFETF